MTEILAVAVDLGTTRIKAGCITADGEQVHLTSADTPPLTGQDPIRESDPEAYAQRVDECLEQLRTHAPGRAALGIASQRSSFLVWRGDNGNPVTPLISWMDRRASDWCERHAHLEEPVYERTGLRLSPHYFGPKLAHLCDTDASVRSGLQSGALLCGTLETYLVWRWSRGDLYQTDVTMAGRSLLAELGQPGWSAALMQLLGLPVRSWPAVRPSRRVHEELAGGFTVCASIADQASSAWSVFGSERGRVLINMGTGCFVLSGCGSSPSRHRGYLAGPYYADKNHTYYTLEGTVNGGGGIADGFSSRSEPPPVADASPHAFCLPDTGVGAPHWRPELFTRFSAEGEALDGEAKRRVFLEGLVFRLREIVDDLAPKDAGAEIIVSGGLSRDPFVAPALAACLDRPVGLLEESESTLLGAGRLAAGISGRKLSATKIVRPGEPGQYLQAKYGRWREWMREVLGGSGPL